MTLSAERDKYFQTLKIDRCDKSKVTRTLERAYALRTFEIEHYWKRATYFWGFQVAIFAAFGLLWRGPSSSDQNQPIAVLLCALGVLTGIANFLSAKGSRFWQKNWERHIDVLEIEVEGNLHKTVWLSDGKASFSVSRLNEALGLCLAVFWLLTFLLTASEFAKWRLGYWLGREPLVWIGIVVAGIFGGWAMLISKRSAFYGSFPNGDGSHGAPIRINWLTGRVSPKPPSAKFILRYRPDEEGS